jgi:hypothetical protein
MSKAAHTGRRSPEGPARQRGGLARGARRGLAVLGAILGLTLARPAEAQSGPPLDSAQMAEAMHTYFAGERGAGPLFFGAGLLGVGAGTVMALKGGDITRGAGFPMIGLGLVQGIVGSTLLLGTNKRVAKQGAELAKDPAAWKRNESKRMDGVNRSLVALMVIEGVLIAAGTTTAVVAAQKECCRTLQGIGLGVAAESAVTLMLDIFAAARAQEYADNIRRFEPSSSGAAFYEGGGAAPMSFRPISFSGRF